MGQHKPLPKPQNTLSDKDFRRLLNASAKQAETRTARQSANHIDRQQNWRKH